MLNQENEAIKKNSYNVYLSEFNNLSLLGYNLRV